MMQISKSPPYPTLQPLRPPTPVSTVRPQTNDGESGYTPLPQTGRNPVIQAVAGQLLQRDATLGLREGASGNLSNHEITGTLGVGREPSAHQRTQALSTYRQLAEQTLEPEGGRLMGIDVMV